MIGKGLSNEQLGVDSRQLGLEGYQFTGKEQNIGEVKVMDSDVQQAVFLVNQLKQTLSMAYKQAKVALADGKFSMLEGMQMTMLGTQLAMQIQSMVQSSTPALQNAIEKALVEGEFVVHE